MSVVLPYHCLTVSEIAACCRTKMDDMKSQVSKDELSTAPTVPLNGGEEDESPMQYYFHDMLPYNADDEDLMDFDSESVLDQSDHLDPDKSLVSLQWETPTPTFLLPECFDFDPTEDDFVAGTLEPTEVSDEDDMDHDTTSLESRFGVTVRRLAESMEKSRKTRVSLTLKSPATAGYSRSTSISHIVTSVEESCHQLLSTFGESPSTSPLTAH